MQEEIGKKVFVLGLDGATFAIMLPMIEQGRLPTFAKIIKEGAHGPLMSTVVSNSAPAWTSFSTGKNPGKHSIGGFFRLVPNSYQLKLLNGSDNKAKTMWEVVGAHGNKSIVVNIPMTYPPAPINGIMVSGLDTPSLSCDFTHPKEIKEELLRVVPDYKINLHLGGYLYSHKRRKKGIEVMLSSTRARTRAVLHLMGKHPWDLFVVRFNSPDNVQHQYWKFMDKTHPLYDEKCPDELKQAVYTVYDALDEAAAAIIEKLPKDCTLMIMSDHGAGPRSNKTVRLNEWLKRLGYLASKETKKKRKKFIRRNFETVLSTFLKRVPPGIKQWIAKVAPGTVSKTWTYFRFPNIDWDNTRAFVGETEGIRINSKGTYPNGTVSEQEYEPLRDKLISEIYKISDPATGEAIFKDVFKREAVFTGPHVKLFPDIIALTTKDQYNISTKMAPEAVAPERAILATEDHWRSVSGSHRPEGIFVIRGNNIKADVGLPASNIADVFPTVAYLMGVPIPSDIDGKVVESAFCDEFLKSHPIRYAQISEDARTDGGDSGDQYDDKEKDVLVDHLRALGYIE